MRRTPLYAEASEPTTPLRVVLVTPPLVPKWLAVFVSESRASSAVDLDIVFLENASMQEAGAMPFDLRLFLGLERLMSRSLGRVVGRSRSGPLSTVSLDGAGDGRERRKASDKDSLLAHVRELRADLVLLHGPAEMAPMLSPLARHGCWMLDPDMMASDRAGLALLVPVLQGSTVTGLSLYLMPDDAGNTAGEALVTSHGATSAMSFSQQRDLAFAKLPALLLRALRKLRAAPSATPGAVRSLRVTPPSFVLRHGLGARSFLMAIRHILQWRGRRVRARLPWFLLLPEEGSALDPTAPSVGRHLSLVAPDNDYWADPYPVVEGGRRLLFVEELVGAQGKGIIVCLELLDEGRAVRHGVVLDEDAHLSYPQVFQWEGAWYMTVESCEANRVSLYLAEEFPLRWRRVADLIEGRECVDPTLHHQDGTWYLFANISESGGGLSDELFLFTSDALAGPYRPHPANPILSDARMSRPAGRLFHHEGRLVRPAQCCVPIYGTAVVFNEVMEMTPERYRERPMATLEPNAMPGLDGCHTYNAWDGFEALDAHGWPPGADSRMRIVEIGEAGAGQVGTTPGG